MCHVEAWNVSRSFQRVYASTAKIGLEKKSARTVSKGLKEALQNRDIVFYQSPPAAERMFFFMYISAGVQLFFWGNLASLSYDNYSKKERTVDTQSFPTISDAEDAPYVLAPLGQRIAISASLVAVGLGIAGAMCTYPWRYIERMILLKGASRIRLVTHARFLPSQKIKEYPLERLYSKQMVHTGLGKTGTDALGKSTSSQIILRVQGERMGYTMDRHGKFTDSMLFDKLFYQS
ncbi:hypothetical protein DFQ28_010279 [Apophysomyces sp. BC1034]|nr:hypothetical protein DFQ30_009896 [Apophysomyces sp. BC1015]KAG0171549.1 hypothetical protein DFQ29_008783 [Apophysomyces sp. BC1021]KAG0184890.1 hypothetical protein DFQ28_010279 [Apophysomyces sp. BC1034]